jgi:predicted AAA+ superfamily ATPase
LILDEIHRLDNPSELLKIAADHHRRLRVIATGSSSLGASKKFRDTLTGRKEEVLLTPMNTSDLDDFGDTNLVRRLQHGGLPPFFLNTGFEESDYQEWVDSYWAKDIQELFRLERRASFTRFIELLFLQSGGIFEASNFAGPCEVSRPTIQNYLSVLEATFVAQIIRPFHTNRAVEIIAAPKVYAFDTGFVCAFRGWNTLRRDDYGPLWEHYVLNELRSRFPRKRLHYWRDKQKHEVDFVLGSTGKTVDVLECKWSFDTIDPASLRIFRRHYPEGRNFLVCRDVTRSFTHRAGDLNFRVIPLTGLEAAIADRA